LTGGLRVGGAYCKRCDTMRLFVFAWEKQKITRRETYMHKVDRTLQAICKLRGAKLARGDYTTKHLG
jgi:hypothetical protein